MFCVCDRITDDLDGEISKSPEGGMKLANVFQEDLEDTTRLFVNKTGDALDTTSTSQTADSGLSDPLDVVAQDLAVTLCAALSQTLIHSQPPAN